MVKKKYLVGFFTLLFTLLLGCYGNCYAVEKGQVQNLMYNYMVNNGGKSDTEARQIITANEESVFNLFNNYYNDNYGVIGLLNGNIFYICFVNLESSSKSTYTTNSNYGWYINEYGWIGFMNNGTSFTKNNRNGREVGSRYGRNLDFYYTDIDIYQGNTNNIYIAAGSYTPSWLNLTGDYYQEKYWSFTPSNSDVVYVPSFEPYKFEPMTLVNVNTINLGTLIGGLHCDEIRLVRVYYSNNDWVMSKGVTFYKYPQNGSLLSFTGGTSDQDWTCPINMNLSNYANNILAIQFNSNDSNYPSIRHWFFIENNNTIVNNGNVDSNSTFSGDYYNSYNDQNNINNINDNNDLNTEEIVGAIGGLVSSDYSGDLSSGDIPSIDIEDPTDDFFTWFYRQFVNILNNNNNVDLILPIWKTDYRIPSNVFVLDIEPLRSFISLGWWVIVGVPFLKFIRRSIEKLKGGNVPMSDEKSDLLGNVL